MSHHGFTGHEHDESLRLINMRGRMFNPAIGRMLTPDPIVEMPAANHSIGDPRQHPFGNAAGSGLTLAQRAEFNAWRVE